MTGCLRTQISGQFGRNNSAASSAGAYSSAGSSAATGSSTGTDILTGSGTGTSGSGSTGSSAASSSGGSGTTGGTAGTPPPPIIDGGYVFCFVSDSPVGGPDRDGGAVSWMCEPGTYLCDLQGPPGNCFQCLSDSDCANRGLPTYDRNRPRCDLASGVSGYQNFCVECVGNDDCAGNRADPFCDLAAPLYSEVDAPPPDLVGFEACGPIDTDCRVDGGPRCDPDQFCSLDSGVCTYGELPCATDAECVGRLANDQNQLIPYCVDGACGPCPSGTCEGFCSFGETCRLDPHPDASVCSQPVSDCPPCQSSSDCAGLWPACVPADGGNFCGCSTDVDCADAGLTCLNPGTTSSYCGISCFSPGAPSCAANAPICEPDSGLCTRCNFGDDCLNARSSAGYVCTGDGVCGCFYSSDCPSNEVCVPGNSFNACGPPDQRCSPATCEAALCNWDAGVCEGLNSSSPRSCLTDFDCTVAPQADAFCLGGTCVQCLDDNDCVVTAPKGRTNRTFCCEAGDNVCSATQSHTCIEACDSSADCAGSTDGTFCVVYDDAGQGMCRTGACLSNADCAADPQGLYCDRDSGPGYLLPAGGCGCFHDSDCPTGTLCDGNGSVLSSCTTSCVDGGCAPGRICDQSGVCRSRCDDGHTCDTADPLCDADNRLGNNGIPDPGVEWCYACITSADCSSGQGCDATFHICGLCQTSSDCASGVCAAGPTCLARCEAGVCSAGQVCDTDNAVGNGANLCYECLSPIDCPDGEGCNSATHRCGTCEYPNAYAFGNDCPPGDICTNYWSVAPFTSSGACLQRCDDRPCPADHPICATFPSLTPDHALCFGCLSDGDCASAGAGYWCDTSVSLTFVCTPPGG